MPLTSKGEEIKSNMENEYGKKKGESVFYASANKGTIKGVHNDRSDAMSGYNKDGGPGSGPQPGGGTKSNEEIAEIQKQYEPGGSKYKPDKSKSMNAAFRSMAEINAAKAKKAEAKKHGPWANDQTKPDPATGPMSTKGPSAGKSEGLPEAATPSSKPASDCAMSLDAIKSMGKRIGRY